MLDKRSMSKADLVTSLLLVGLGVAVIVGSMRMPMGGQYGGVNNPWYASPAMLPLLVGSTLVLLALLLLVRALGQGALAGLGGVAASAAKGLFTSRGVRRCALVYLLLVLYAGMLYMHPLAGAADVLARMAWLDNRISRFLLYPEGANYVLVSFLFLLSFTWLFYQPGGRRCGWRATAGIGGLSLLVSLLVGYCFSELLNVPLP